MHRKLCDDDDDDDDNGSTCSHLFNVLVHHILTIPDSVVPNQTHQAMS